MAAKSVDREGFYLMVMSRGTQVREVFLTCLRTLFAIMIFALPAIADYSCLTAFENHTTIRAKLMHMMNAADTLPLINRNQLKNLKIWDSASQDRTGGRAGIYRAEFQGRQVVVKEGYDLQEYKFARFLSNMGWGVHVFGRADFCDCYIMEYVPDALLISYRVVDKHEYRFMREGFYINSEMRARMQFIIESLGKIKFAPGDLQFLVTKEGRVLIIDSEFFSVEDPILNIGHPVAGRQMTHKYYNGLVLERILLRIDTYNKDLQNLFRPERNFGP